jgi:hypothetical protein
MTKIELAQAAAKRRHDEYLKACQRVAALVREREERAKSNIAKIRAAAEARVAKVQHDLEYVRTPDIQGLVRNAVVAERAELGLAS